jgi:hypothetical protein
MLGNPIFEQLTATGRELNPAKQLYTPDFAEVANCDRDNGEVLRPLTRSPHGLYRPEILSVLRNLFPHPICPIWEFVGKGLARSAGDAGKSDRPV